MAVKSYHVEVCVVNDATGGHYWFQRVVKAENIDDALEKAKTTVRLLDGERFSTSMTKIWDKPPMTARGE